MHRKTGVLLIGALGHLATTVILGAIALGKGLCAPTGMVTTTADFNGLDLVPVDDFVFGGWDIRQGNNAGMAMKLLQQAGVAADQNQLVAINRELELFSAAVWPGTAINCGNAIEEMVEQSINGGVPTLLQLIDRLREDIDRFRLAHNLKTVVVVNLSSTEPPLPDPDAALDLPALVDAINNNRNGSVRASTIYAYAAITAGCPFINFTPSSGSLMPGLVALAEQHRVPVMGSDGKTGETLVKSVLAPLFAYRNLQVLSWEGYNMLGNLDGKILANPDNAATKIKSKDRVLGNILGYRPHSKVSIDYVPSLGDQKTAWDFIHFEGFLNTRMSLQFTWQGSDSALAAPLVLDLIRLVEFAGRQGESGLLPHLAAFFKSPIGIEEQNMHKQFSLLLEYAARHTTGG